jgi:hypothetical protein
MKKIEDQGMLCSERVGVLFLGDDDDPHMTWCKERAVGRGADGKLYCQKHLATTLALAKALGVEDE